MPDARKMKRIGKLYSKGQFIEQISKEYGYNEDDLKKLFRHMEDALCENLASGNSVHLLDGLFVEVMEHPGHRYYNLNKKEMDYLEAYPVLYFRVTAKMKDRIFVDESKQERDKTERYDIE